MTGRPPLATAQVIGLPEVEAAILYGSRALGRHPALLAHIEGAGVELYRRPDSDVDGLSPLESDSSRLQ